jgi:hypothetical protein
MALAAGKFMRIGGGHALRLGQGDFVEEGEDGLVERSAGERSAIALGAAGEGFCHLLADAHQRVEGGKGFLEDDGDGCAAKVVQFAIRGADDLLAGENGGA